MSLALGTWETADLDHPLVPQIPLLAVGPLIPVSGTVAHSCKLRLLC